MVNATFARALLEQLDGWVNDLAAPLLPPRTVPEGSGLARLEFREHTPHAVMIGKSVRAVSGLRAALALSDLGYLAECAALLRMVSDFCTEITAVGEALNSGGKFPAAVHTFVEQYFTQKPRTPEQLDVAERAHYISREELMKAEVRLAARANINGEQLRENRRFLNMTFDAYVHGAYETTMELYDPPTGRFVVNGHPAVSKRREFVEFVFLKLHEVVCAIEITAAVTSNDVVFKVARNARRALDATMEQSPRTRSENKE